MAEPMQSDASNPKNLEQALQEANGALADAQKAAGGPVATQEDGLASGILTEAIGGSIISTAATIANEGLSGENNSGAESNHGKSSSYFVQTAKDGGNKARQVARSTAKSIVPLGYGEKIHHMRQQARGVFMGVRRVGMSIGNRDSGGRRGQNRHPIRGAKVTAEMARGLATDLLNEIAHVLHLMQGDNRFDNENAFAERIREGSDMAKKFVNKGKHRRTRRTNVAQQGSAGGTSG